MINFRQIARVLSVLLIIIGFMMFTGLPFSYYFDSGDGMALLISGLICLATASALWFVSTNERGSISRREGYLIVALGWVVMVTAGIPVRSVP